MELPIFFEDLFSKYLPSADNFWHTGSFEKEKKTRGYSYMIKCLYK